MWLRYGAQLAQLGPILHLHRGFYLGPMWAIWVFLSGNHMGGIWVQIQNQYYPPSGQRGLFLGINWAIFQFTGT